MLSPKSRYKGDPITTYGIEIPGERVQEFYEARHEFREFMEAQKAERKFSVRQETDAEKEFIHGSSWRVLSGLSLKRRRGLGSGSSIN